MELVALISPTAATLGAIASICGGIYSYRQAEESKAHADRAVEAAESIAFTTRMKMAADQKRLFLEPREGNKLRVHNPGVESIRRIEVSSDQIPNSPVVLSAISPGEYKDIELTPRIPMWGFMHFTATIHFHDGATEKLEYSKADIRPQWRRE